MYNVLITMAVDLLISSSHPSIMFTYLTHCTVYFCFKYFSPYLSADMSKMATAFNTTVTHLEEELMQLILDSKISARIDSHNKVWLCRATEITLQ